MNTALLIIILSSGGYGAEAIAIHEIPATQCEVMIEKTERIFRNRNIGLQNAFCFPYVSDEELTRFKNEQQRKHQP